MLSTPIFEQLCREFVNSGNPEDTCAEIVDVSQDETVVDTATVPAAGPEPVSDTEPIVEAGPEPAGAPKSASGADQEAEPEPARAVESGARPEVEAGWSASAERVA